MVLRKFCCLLSIVTSAASDIEYVLINNDLRISEARMQHEEGSKKISSCWFLASFIFVLEYGGYMFIRNVRSFSKHYMVLYQNIELYFTFLLPIYELELCKSVSYELF
jgi:hypothetical protein